MSCLKKTRSKSAKKEREEKLHKTDGVTIPQHFNENLPSSKLTYSAQYQAPNCQQCCNSATTNVQNVAPTQCDAYCNTVPLYNARPPPVKKEQQFVYYPCPCNNNSPPCMPSDDLWDLQFCRWWGWNWIRKREEMLNQRKKSPDADVFTNEKLSNKKHAKGCKQGEFFGWCKKLFKKRHKQGFLKSEEKKQLQQLYATPCSSIVFNDICSCPIDLECPSLNLEGQYECYSNSTRQTSLSTVIIKNKTRHEARKHARRKHQSWILEKSESASSDDYCPCLCPRPQKADSSTEDSSEYLSQRIVQIKSGCECNSGCSCRKIKLKKHCKNSLRVVCCAQKNNQKENFNIYCPYAVKLVYKKKAKHQMQKPIIHEELEQTVKLPSPSKSLPLCNTSTPAKVSRLGKQAICKYPSEIKKAQKRKNEWDCCDCQKKTYLNCCPCRCQHLKKKIRKLETPKMYCCHCCCCCICKGKTQKSSIEELLRLFLEKNMSSPNDKSKNLTDAPNKRENGISTSCCKSNNLSFDKNTSNNFSNSAQCRILKDFNEKSSYKSPLTGKMYSVEPTMCTTKEIFYTNTFPKPLSVTEKLLNYNICSSGDVEHSVLLRAVCEAIMSSHSNKEQDLKAHISSQGDYMSDTNKFWAPKHKPQKSYINKIESSHDKIFHDYNNQQNGTCTKFTLPKTTYNSFFNSYNYPNCDICADEVPKTTGDSVNLSEADEGDGFETRSEILFPHHQLISSETNFSNNFMNKRRLGVFRSSSDILHKTLIPFGKGNQNTITQKWNDKNVFRSNSLENNAYCVSDNIPKKICTKESLTVHKALLKSCLWEFGGKPYTSDETVKFLGMPHGRLFVSINDVKIRSPELINEGKSYNLKGLQEPTLHNTICANNRSECREYGNILHHSKSSHPLALSTIRSLPVFQDETDANKIFQTKTAAAQSKKQLEYITFVNDDTFHTTSSQSGTFEVVKPRYITCPIFKIDTNDYRADEATDKKAGNLNASKADKFHKNHNLKVSSDDTTFKKSAMITKNKPEEQVGCQLLNESNSTVQRGFRKGSHLTHLQKSNLGTLPINSSLNEQKEKHFTTTNDYEREMHNHHLSEFNFHKYASVTQSQQELEIELNKHVNDHENRVSLVIPKGQLINHLNHLSDGKIKSEAAHYHRDNYLKLENCPEAYVNQQKSEVDMGIKFLSSSKQLEYVRDIEKELGYYNLNSSFEDKQEQDIEHATLTESDSNRSETKTSNKSYQEQKFNECISVNENSSFTKEIPKDNINESFQQEKSSDFRSYIKSLANDWPSQKQQQRKHTETDSISVFCNEHSPSQPPSQVTVSTSPLQFKHPSVQAYQTPIHATTSPFITQYPTASGRSRMTSKNQPYREATSSRESPFSMFCVPVAHRNIRRPHPDDNITDLSRPEKKIIVAKLKEREKRWRY